MLAWARDVNPVSVYTTDRIHSTETVPGTDLLQVTVSVLFIYTATETCEVCAIIEQIADRTCNQDDTKSLD